MSERKRANRVWLELSIAFVSGALFAVGLAIAGMTQPSKVVAFLDVSGNWDPSLAFVMAAAIAVYFPINRLVQRRMAPIAGSAFHLPTRRDLDPKLVVGSCLFGIGWALAGYCPGPGITALGAGSRQAALFVVAMAVGMLLFEAFERARTRELSGQASSPR